LIYLLTVNTPQIFYYSEITLLIQKQKNWIAVAMIVIYVSYKPEKGSINMLIDKAPTEMTQQISEY
jgi:hypothetical protein